MHLVYSFDVGGLENGVANLINHMPAERFRHAVVALTHCAPAFCQRITRADVDFLSLHKPPGHGIKLYPRLYRLFRERRPAVVHTRNLAALECVNQRERWMALAGHIPQDIADALLSSPERWAEVRALLNGGRS